MDVGLSFPESWACCSPAAPGREPTVGWRSPSSTWARATPSFCAHPEADSWPWMRVWSARASTWESASWRRSSGPRRARTLDGFLLSHAHPDHAGGAPFLLGAFLPSVVWEGPAPRARSGLPRLQRGHGGRGRRPARGGARHVLGLGRCEARGERARPDRYSAPGGPETTILSSCSCVSARSAHCSPATSRPRPSAASRRRRVRSSRSPTTEARPARARTCCGRSAPASP